MLREKRPSVMVSQLLIKVDHKPPSQEVEEVATEVEAEVVTDHKLAVEVEKEVEVEEVEKEVEVEEVAVVATEVAEVVMVKEEDNSSEEPQERDQLMAAQKTSQEVDSMLMGKTEIQIRDHQEDQETRVEKVPTVDMTERTLPAEVEEEISKVANSVRATKSREPTSKRELKLPPPLSQQRRPRRKKVQLRMRSKSSTVSHSMTTSTPTH